mgnify:CR=1 FL=1
MRYLLFLTLFFTLVFGISAQDDILMPDDLPDPVYTEDISQIFYYADPHQFAWIDNETLVFAPYRELYAYEESQLDIAYHYSLSTGTLTQLDSSPFHATMSEETRNWFQVSEYATTVYQSPYILEGGGTYTHHIMYISRFSGRCGIECSNAIMMRGRYAINSDGELDESLSSFMPIETNYTGNITLFWTRNGLEPYALLQMSIPYGQGEYVYISHPRNDIRTPIYLHNLPEDRILAVSDDGTRAAYSSHHTEPGASESGQKLYIWHAPYHDEHCACTYDGRLYFINPVNPESQTRRYSFAGASFVDEDTILYIGDMGLMRHNLLTGISTIIDPELNVSWIRTAVFSPDNQHVAITTEQGLYVLPLDL